MAKITLDQLPMRVFRSTCKRGKIIPLWGTNSLRKSKEKNERKIQIQRRKTKMTKSVYEIVTNKIIEKLEQEQYLGKSLG